MQRKASFRTRNSNTAASCASSRTTSDSNRWPRATLGRTTLRPTASISGASPARSRPSPARCRAARSTARRRLRTARCRTNLILTDGALGSLETAVARGFDGRPPATRPLRGTVMSGNERFHSMTYFTRASATLALVGATALCVTGCGGGSNSSAGGLLPGNPVLNSNALAMQRKLIKHIVVIYQENRTFDNMFNGYPGADSAQYGEVHTGQVIHLQPISLAVGYNIGHKGKDYFTAYNKGLMNGFDLVAAGNVGSAHGYVLVPPFPEYAF